MFVSTFKSRMSFTSPTTLCSVTDPLSMRRHCVILQKKNRHSFSPNRTKLEPHPKVRTTEAEIAPNFPSTCHGSNRTSPEKYEANKSTSRGLCASSRSTICATSRHPPATLVMLMCWRQESRVSSLRQLLFRFGAWPS